MEKIKSNQNSHVKSWVKLKTKKGRQESQTYLLDGWHIVQEAIHFNGKIHSIIINEDQYELHKDELPVGVPVFIIYDNIVKKLSDLVTPQGVFAEVSLPKFKRTPKYIHEGAWLFLDAIQDPGNVGTMVRTADAAGFSGVIFGAGSVDPYSPKVIRAMQGSQFHLQLANGDLHEWIPEFVRNDFKVYGTQLNYEATNIFEISPVQNFALIMGNEGKGMSNDLVNMTNQNLYIPLNGNAESLNVAVAAGVAMFTLKH